MIATTVTAANIIEASNFIVRNACENTWTGNYLVGTSDVAKHTHMTSCEVYMYREQIMEQMYKRNEIFDVEFDYRSGCFDVTCALAYCPQYQWCEGDEEIFGCSFEEWMLAPSEPIVDATE